MQGFISAAAPSMEGTAVHGKCDALEKMEGVSPPTTANKVVMPHATASHINNRRIRIPGKTLKGSC